MDKPDNFKTSERFISKFQEESPFRRNSDDSKNNMRNAINYELDYRAAMRGDKLEQEFIKEMVQQWHDLPANAPIRNDLTEMLNDMGQFDPEAANLFRKGIIDGAGSIEFK